jgi:acyl-[acyl carrier protein]--UDP-N-acetylglucosamine O-acyltransferase
MFLTNAIQKIWLKVLREFAPLQYASKVGVHFGKGCKFIKPNFGTEPYLIRIGDHVEITYGVHFITHDGAVWIFRGNRPDIDVFGPITIGSNVFVGLGSTILPGVSIGDNCIIGAGSVVTRDIPSNSVAAGIPARVLKSVDQYYDSIKDNAFDIRTLSYAEKRRILEQKFFGNNARHEKMTNTLKAKD